MAEGQTCYFTVVRYVSDPIRNEPRNIGVIVLSPHSGFAAGRFRLSRTGLRPDTTKYQLLEGTVKSLEIDLPSSVQPTLFAPIPPTWTPDRLELLHEECTGIVQFSLPGGALGDPQKLLDELFRERVPPPERRGGNFSRGTAAASLRKAFRRAGRPEDWIKSDVQVKVGQDNYFFELGIGNGKLQYAVETLSFLNTDLQRQEERGGWFSHVWPRVGPHTGAQGVLVIEPSDQGIAQTRLRRVSSWATEAGIRVESAEAMPELAEEMASALPVPK